MKPTVTNHSHYTGVHEAEDGPAIRQLFIDYCHAAGFTQLTKWPADFEEATVLFQPMEEPVVCESVRLNYSVPDERNHTSVQMALNDDKHNDLLLMVQQRKTGQWWIYVRLDKAYLKALPGAGAIVGDFIRRVMAY